MEYYIQRLKNNRNYKMVFILLVILMNVDLFILNNSTPGNDPHFSTFLSGGSIGHYMQMLVLWLMPAYLLLGASSWYLIDEKNKTVSILITKYGKKKYLSNYLKCVFYSTFIMIFVSLMINYGLALLLNHAGEMNSLFGNDWSDMPDLQMQLNHPFLTNIAFIFLTSIFISILAVFISCISFYFKKLSYVFLLSFTIWFVLISGNHSILLTFQPFAEYSFSYLGKIYLIVVAILIICSLGLYIYMVKQDDL